MDILSVLFTVVKMCLPSLILIRIIRIRIGIETNKNNYIAP